MAEHVGEELFSILGPEKNKQLFTSSFNSGIIVFFFLSAIAIDLLFFPLIDFFDLGFSYSSFECFFYIWSLQCKLPSVLIRCVAGFNPL